MAQAKRDFVRGYIREAEIKWLGLGLGYGLMLTHRIADKTIGNLDASGFLIDAKKHQPRQFKTADACIQAAKQIGFQASSLKIEGE
jgi:hypothetical protein